MAEELEAWEAIHDSIDVERTRTAVLERMFGESGEPTKLGRFTVLGTAGEGQMGRVYIAHDPELDRKVAIKLIRRFGLDEHGVEKRRARMIREAQAMAKVHHPNVIAVHEVGRLGEDAFIVMEYVAAPNLREWLAERLREWREILPVFVGAGRGLAAAHARDLVHRDFKPDNVLVAPGDGASARAIVLDFGLARQPVGTSSDAEPTAPSDGALATELTVTGAAIGTPAYMAPEQMAGIAADARSDQFSFCVALFEAVHGVRPFVAPTYEEMIEKIRAGALSQPRPAPDWLQSAISRGLHYDPEQRFPAMYDLIRELSRRRFSARFVAAVGLGALAIAGAGASGAALLTDDTPACDTSEARIETVWGPPQRAALLQAFADSEVTYAPALGERVALRFDTHAASWVTMHRDACEATNVRHEQSAQLLDLRNACLDRRLAELRAAVEVLATPDAKTIVRAGNLAAALGEIKLCADTKQLLEGTALPTDPAQRQAIEAASDRLATANALTDAARYEDANEVLRDVEAREVVYPPLHANVLYLRGTLEYNLGGNNGERFLLDAVSAAEGAREDRLAANCWRSLAERTRGNNAADARAASYLERFDAATVRLGDPPNMRADVFRARGLLAHREGRYEEAAVHRRAALDLYRDSEDRRAIATLRIDLASGAFQQGRYAEAAAEFEQAERLMEAIHGPQHPFTGRAVTNRGTALVALGRNREAIPVLERAIAIHDAAHGPDHSGVGPSVNALASAYYSLGDFAAAKPLYLKTLRIYEQSVGPADSRLGPPLSNLARVQSHLGEDDRAIASARRALEIVEAARGPDHIELPTLWAGLGHVYTRAGKFSDAADAHRRALALRRKLRGDDHAETAYSQRSLAEALRRLGRPREALPPARQAAETIEDRLGEEHPQLASALLTLGRVEQDLDRIADARQHLERALRVYAVAEAPPTEIAEAKFALARVVAESPGERAYATRLADEADAVLADHGSTHEELRAQIAQARSEWL